MISVFITLILGLVEHYMSTLHVRMELFSADSCRVIWLFTENHDLSFATIRKVEKIFAPFATTSIYYCWYSIGSIILKAAGKPIHIVYSGGSYVL